MFDAVLFVVATPIGNLGDMTPRAVEVLQSVALIAAEDTRHSSRLMAHFNIKAPMISLHDHNERQRLQTILDKLAAGDSIALISDAGTPLISDPGFILVRAVREAGFKVVPVPGACAVITAMCASGVPTDKFVFEGFLPAKRVGRKQKFEALVAEERTVIFYESTHRLIKTLTQLAEFFGEDRQVSVSRELTKMHEENIRGTVKEVLEYYNNNVIKGEIVIVVHGVEK